MLYPNDPLLLLILLLVTFLFTFLIAIHLFTPRPIHTPGLVPPFFALPSSHSISPPAYAPPFFGLIFDGVGRHDLSRCGMCPPLRDTSLLSRHDIFLYVIAITRRVSHLRDNSLFLVVMTFTTSSVAMTSPPFNMVPFYGVCPHLRAM